MKLNEFLAQYGSEKKLAQLLGEHIPSAVKRIAAAITEQSGEKAGTENIYGEQQLALDVLANKIVLEELEKSKLVSDAASEEMDELVMLNSVQDDTATADYTVVFDPLDGSSLVDVNFAVGSIFGFYPSGNPVGRTGDEQVAACFAVYGPRTTLVLTIKKGVQEFRLAADGNFHLIKESLRVAEQAKHFAPGNLRAAQEREDYLRLTTEWIKSGLTLRYSGGMVPDINHILLKGNGIFTYPGYSKAPEGKLRLLFECNPMALIMEQAGGEASDGSARILSRKITELHKRTPIYIGSKEAVLKTVQALTK